MYATALRNFSLSCSLSYLATFRQSLWAITWYPGSVVLHLCLGHNKPLNGCVFLQALLGRRKFSLWIEDIQSRCGNAGCRVGRIAKALCQKYHHQTILTCWCLTALSSLSVNARILLGVFSAWVMQDEVLKLLWNLKVTRCWIRKRQIIIMIQFNLGPLCSNANTLP